MINDPRLDEILELTHKLSIDTLNDRGDDKLDQIIQRLNRYINQREHQFDEMIDVVISAASLDFSKRVTLNKKLDTFAALGTAINALAEELQAKTISRDELKNIIHAMDDMLLVLNPDMTIRLVNQSLLQNLGYPVDGELIGQPLEAILADDNVKDRQQLSTHDVQIQFLRRKDGTTIPISFSVAAMVDDAENVSGIVFIGQDISERLQHQKALEESEQRLKEAQRIAKMGNWEWNIVTGEISWSDEIYTISGQSRDDPLLPYPDFLQKVYPEDRDLVQTSLEAALHGELYNVEYRAYKQDGSIVYKHARGRTVFNNDGKPIRMVGVVQDITERKQIELAKRTRDLQYRAIFESTLMGIVFADPAGEIIQCNPSFENILGYTFDELKNHKLSDLVHPDDLPIQIELHQQIVRDERDTYQIEKRYIHKSGWEVYAKLFLSAIRKEDRRIDYYIGLVTDITEQKLAQQEQEKLSRIVETSTDFIGIAALDRQGLYLNQAGADIVGLKSPAHVTQTEMMDYLTPATQTQWQEEAIPTALETGIWQGESHLKHFQTGEAIPVDSRLFLVYDPKTRGPQFFAAILRDITEQKASLSALEKEKTFVNAILDNAGALIIVLDREGRIRRFNRACADLSEYDFEEVVGKFPWETFLPPEDAVVIKQEAFDSLIEHNVQREHYVNYWQSKTGKRYLIEWSNTMLFNGIDDMDYIISIGIDITERVQTQAALRQSEILLKEAQHIARMGNWGWNILTNGLVWSDEIYHIFGFAPVEFEPTYPRFLEAVHPEDRDSVETAVSRALKGDPYSIEHRVQKPDGSISYVHEQGQVSYDKHGEAIRMVGVVQDITERKQTEKALQLSQQHLNIVVNNLPVMLYALDRDGIFTLLEGKGLKMVGLAPGQSVGLSAFDLFGDVVGFREKFERTLSGETIQWVAEARGVHMEVVYSPLIDEQSNIIGITGVSYDITERIQMEQAIVEKENRFRSLFEQSLDGIFLVNEQGVVLEFNQGAERITGLSAQDIVGRRFVDMFVNLAVSDRRTPEVRQQLELLFDEMMNNEESSSINQLVENLIEKPDGSRANIQSVSFIIKTPRQRLLGSILRDITSQIRIQEALRESEERYRSIVETAEEGIWLLDHAAQTTYVNPKMADMLGFDVNEMLDTRMFDYMDEVQHYQASTQFERHRQGIKEQYEVRFKRKDGSDVWTFVSTNPLTDEQGKFSGVLSMVTDITTLKNIEEELQQLNITLEQRVKDRTLELEAANEEVRRFAYIVSHDLRAPLVNIQGFAGELRGAYDLLKLEISPYLSNLEAAHQEKVRIALKEDIPVAFHFIDASVRKIDNFIEAILSLSRLGQREFTYDAVDINKLVKDILSTIQHYINKHQVEITVRDLPTIQTDRITMEQIMSNVITNAVLYLKPTQPGKVELYGEVKDSEVLFYIRDNGIGIAQEDFEKVFAPFRRVGNSKTVGEGIGLTYVQTLVRRLGGKIWFESEPNIGTTFIISIPRI